MQNKVKGTYDILPSEIKKWHFLENKIREITKKYNYEEIRTPVFEYSPVFHRDGELSDMVTKETYNFLDKGNRELTLKPEGTAGVIRSYVENKLYATNDLYKVYYISNMYRYERPQKGRYREFRQFGLEAIGSKNALIDAEVIKLSSEFIESLGLKEVSVLINSIGDDESRKKYQKALVNYLIPYIDELSDDSKRRINTNPLRILDSKDKNDQKIIKDAPKPIDYLSKESRNYLEEVLNYLKIFNVNYELDNKLVRGLDYYSEVVFEVKANIKNFGAQNILGGGGRYENLVSELGGPKTSAIGIAFGMERLLLALEYEEIVFEDEDYLDSYIITFDKKFNNYAATILNQLRNNNYLVDLDYNNRSFKAQLRRALNKNSKTLIIIGEDEYNNNQVTLKNTKSEEQVTIPIKDLLNHLKEELK